MEFQIKRIDLTLPMPVFQTSGAVGFDLLARETTIIPARGIGLVPNNIIVNIPDGFMFMIASRSSTLKKTGLMVGNGVGIIDQDYFGPEDEIHTLFYNISDKDVIVEKGSRLSQGIFVKVGRGDLIESNAHFTKESRGGFGTTGD